MKMLICTMLVGIILSGTSAAVIDVPFVGRFFPSESGDRSVGSNNPQSRNNFVPIRTATSVSGGSLYEAHDYQRSFGKTTGDGDKFCEGDFADVGKGSEVDNVVNDIDRKSHDDNNTQSVRGNAEIPLIETTGAVKDRNCGDKQDSGDLQDDGGNSNNGDDSNSSDGPDGSDGSQGSAPADDDSTTQPGAATTKTVEPLNSLRPNDILDLLKQEWAALLEAAPGPRAVERVLSGVPLRDALRGSETLTTNPTDAPHAPHQFAAGSRAPLWANGTDHESLYRQLLAQFLDPLATAGSGSSSSSAVGGSGSGKGRETDTGSMRRRRSLWLDQEFALNLKGTAVLAQHPELLLAGAESISSGSGSIRSKAEAASESATAAMAAAAGLVRRGIRLRAPAPPPPPAPAPAAAQQPPPGMSMDFLGMGGFGSFAPSASPPLGPSPPSSAAAATAPSSSARLSGQCALQNTLVRALAHSLGARMIYLNRRSVEAVRAAGRLRGLPRASLGTANVLRALFDLLRDDPPHHQPLGGYCEEEEGESEGRLRNSSGAGNSGWGTVGGGSVVVLNDALGWLLQSEEASALLLKELQGDQGGRRNTQPASRTVFVAIEPDEAVKIGNALPSAATRTAGAGALADTVAAAGNGYAAEGPPGQQQQPFPFPFPLPPPGFSQGKNGVPLPPAVMGRTFQVVIRNGTATMSALPPGSNGLPLGLIPAPPEAVMRRIIAEHQRRMQQQQHVHNSPDSVASSSTSTTGLPQLPPGSMSFPQLPPGFGGGGPLDPALGKALQSMSGEQLQEFMQDPENQAKMKGLMESIMKTVSEQVARQIGGEGGPGAGDSVDIQLHMMPVPMPVPMHPTPTSAGAGERATTSHGPPAGDRSGQKNEGKKKGFKPDKEGRTRKGSKAGKCGGGGGGGGGKRASRAAEQVAAERAGNGERLPGSFFRGVARRSRGSDTKDSAAHMSSSPSESGSASDTEDARSITPSRTDKRTDNRSSSSGGKGRGGRGRADVSLSGKQVLGLFQEFTLEAPREHGLRVLWERFQEEEVGGRILRANLRLLRVELRHWGLRVERGAVAALGDVLRRKAMAREQVRSAITAAIKLQAGKFDPVHSIGPHIPSVPLSRDAPSANTAVAGEDGLRAAETGAGIEPRRSTDNDAGNDGKEARRATAAPRMVLSHWALDSAFCAALQVPTPRLGRPAARSREEISELAEDKHEKALVANIISPQDIGVTYDQIGGLEEVKELMRQCVTYPLKYPRLYQEGVAAEAVKGVLLFGPPGTGKTMLAKAVATEGGATFMSIDASTIENKWLGESEKNARAVFTLARRLAPCVVYLDEVDSILSSRERGDDSSHGTLTSVKTTLMQEWDGLRTTKDRVVVIASTNRPFDLDEAVLRRLPRRILVDLPDLQTRSEILQVTLAGNRLAADVNVTVLAQQMEGFTGSDIKEVCREAAVRVAHERARMLESGMDVHTTPLATVARSGNSYSDSSRRNCYNEGNHDGGQDMYRQAGVEAVVVPDFNAPLRPICAADFSAALRKLKASVDDSGSEMGKVMEWNEKYGEFKRRRDGGGSNLYSLYV